MAVAFATGASIANQTFMVGSLNEVILPPAKSGTGTGDLTYTLTPNPPAGITFDAATRILSGTPTAAAAAVEYTYKVTDSAKADDGTADPTSSHVDVQHHRGRSQCH